jgi:predicted Zn-dependent peptidase
VTAMRLTTLGSGLRVASHAMPGLQTATVGLFAEAGSRHEPGELNGIAHLFEHMVFKGAGGRSAREISEAIEDVGGDLNACTERDGTSFTASIMAEHLPLAVELLAELILSPDLAEADLEREKDVVLQELGEARDTPGDIIFDNLWSAAFGGQPLGRSILGDEASLGRISAADLQGWRRERFTAGSMVLAAAGKVDHDELAALAEARLAALPRGELAPPEPGAFTGGSHAGGQSSEQAHLTIAFPAPSARADDYFAARLFADIVGGGASSRLFQQLRENRGLAYSVSAHLHPFADIGLFYVHAATARRQAAAAGRLIEDVLAETAQDATQRELDRARTQARAGLLMSLETPWGQAHYLARQLAVWGRLVDPQEIVDQLANISLGQVRAAGARMIAGPRASATIGAPVARAA